MTDVQMRIMIRAVKIRIDRGEKLDDILASYPKLTEEECNYIRMLIEVNIRVNDGEEIDNVLDDYQELTQEERVKVKDDLKLLV